MFYLGQSQLLSGTCANSCAHTGLPGLPWRLSLWSSLTVTLQCHGKEEVWSLNPTHTHTSDLKLAVAFIVQVGKCWGWGGGSTPGGGDTLRQLSPSGADADASGEPESDERHS